MAYPLEEVGPELKICAVLLPLGELVGSLIELAGPVYCCMPNRWQVTQILLTIAESTGLRPPRRLMSVYMSST